MTDLAPDPGISQIGPGSGGQMDDTELRSIVCAEITDSASFIDSQISPLRAKAGRYYNAELFGDEQEGRSRVVSQDVRDTVMGILPSLMEIFCGSENVVEYQPRLPEKQEQAEQATDYVNCIVFNENKGFLEIRNWVKDALIRKMGVIKAWVEDSEDVCAENYSGLDEQSVQYVLEQPGITTQKATPTQDQYSGETTYELHVTRKYPCKSIRFECIPPEELLVARRAKTLEDSPFTCHRTDKYASDLIAMGIPADIVAEEAGGGSTLDMNLERIERQPWLTTFGQDLNNPSMRLIPYFEAYIRVDYDGDGIAEMRRVCLIGDGMQVVVNEPSEPHTFADICPDPEPHTVFGNSVADIVMDIQKIKSQVWRGMLDSLAQSITNRMAVVEGQVNLDDVLNNEVGAVIRMRAPGMVQPFATPFVGQAALPILQMLDDMRESRTGLTKASQGLNADALQSTTQAAVAATVEASQMRIKEIARIFAETGFKRLFKILLRLTVAHQDKAKVVRLRNKWVQVDPREWDADMDVTPNVALGSGTKEDRMNALMGIAAKQEIILQTLGPANPIVTLGQYATTLRKMTELAGYKDSSQFFTALPANYTPPPPQQPTQSPADVLAQMQAKEIAANVQTKQAQLALDREKMLREDALKRFQIETSAQTSLAATAAQFHNNLAANLVKVQSAHAQQDRQIQSDQVMQAQDHSHDLELAQQQAQMAQQQQQQEPAQ